jgi:phosphate transport system permease protein
MPDGVRIGAFYRTPSPLSDKAEKCMPDISSTQAIAAAGFYKKRIRWGEFAVEKSILLIAFLSFAFIVLIFVFVARESLPIFIPKKAASTEVVGQSESYGGEQANDQGMAGISEMQQSEKPVTILDLWNTAWQPVSLNPRFGLWPIILGSFKVALIAIVISAPIAIAAALFSAMFAPNWAREIIKPVIEILAGFPSVVIGFFALIVLASMVQQIFGFQYRLNAFTGGLALSLAIIPIIFTISEDALTAVPNSLVEASLALGARKWETAVFVVLPAATPGIFAAVLLGVGRAIGETMIALMATGNAAIMSINPADPVRTIAATIGAEMAEVVFGDNHYTVLFFIGVLLFLFSFALNFVAEVFVRQRLMKRFKGG